MGSGPSDTVVLRGLLALEQAVVFAYHHVRSLQPTGPPLFTAFAAQENQHAQLLRVTVRNLGATLPPPPRDLKAAAKALAALELSPSLADVRTERQALDFLIELEGAAEGAYFVAIPKLSDPELVRTAAQIMANEAQHTALLRLLRRPREPARAVPNAFVEGRH